jgi:hypothetical protein
LTKKALPNNGLSFSNAKRIFFFEAAPCHPEEHSKLSELKQIRATKENPGGSDSPHPESPLSDLRNAFD